MNACLYDTNVRKVLERMHAESESIDPPLLTRAKGKTGAERAALMETAYIPVDPAAGRFLYTLARNTSGTVVEFGTSFGISTIYMAAGVRDKGEGLVVTTEIYASKAEQARRNIEEAGLLDVVDIRIGDALETLSNVSSGVSLVFLDGMKQLYVPVLKMLEPALKPGAWVVADDTELFPDELEPYLTYVRNPAHGFVSVAIPLGDGMELSTRA